MWYLIYTNELPEVVHGQNCNSNNMNGDMLEENHDGGGEVANGVRRTNVQRPLHQTIPAVAARWRPRYKTEDSQCGTLVSFADASSKSVSDLNIDELKRSMEEQYAASASFLTSSMLQVNGDKTHAMLLTTAQFRRLNNLNLSVNFGNDLQTNSKVERLLGLQLHENLKFR